MNPGADGNKPQLLPCTFCGHATPHSVLAMLGARCVPCYDGYLREPKKLPKVPKSAVPSDCPPGRAWAWRLKWREENAAATGEVITELQRSEWRLALNAHGLLDVAHDGLDVPRSAIDEALLATGDLPMPDHILAAPMFDQYGAPLQ